jgi:hypothetical protein
MDGMRHCGFFCYSVTTAVAWREYEGPREMERTKGD